MGMRVMGGGSASATQSTSAAWQQRQQSFKDLASALHSGDLASAQKAYAGLTNSKNVDPNSPLGKLGQALQSGDLAGAQQAEQALQSSRHHHRGQGGAIASAPQVTAPSTDSTTSSTSYINTTA